MDNNNSSQLFCATVLYPNQKGVDLDLYSKTLIPEYAALLGDNCVRYEVRKGLATPGAPEPDFICIANHLDKIPGKIWGGNGSPGNGCPHAKDRCFHPHTTHKAV